MMFTSCDVFITKYDVSIMFNKFYSMNNNGDLPVNNFIWS